MRKSIFGSLGVKSIYLFLQRSCSLCDCHEILPIVREKRNSLLRSQLSSQNKVNKSEYKSGSVSEDEAELEAAREAGFLTQKTRTRSHELVLLHTTITTHEAESTMYGPGSTQDRPGSTSVIDSNSKARSSISNHTDSESWQNSNGGCDHPEQLQEIQMSAMDTQSEDELLLPYDTRL